LNTSGNKMGARCAAQELSEIQRQLIHGEQRPVSGGFTSALRGIVTLADGSTAFSKYSDDKALAEGIKKEAALYSYLNTIKFPNAPRLLASDECTLVLPDLSQWDWSPNWTKRKLDAVLAAIGRVGRLQPPEELSPLLTFSVGRALEESCRKMVDDAFWKKVIDQSHIFDPNCRVFDEVSREDRRQAAALITAKAFERGVLTHLDVRSDNTAYNAETGEVLLLDWNWAELSSPDLDRAAFLISVFLEHKDPRSDIDATAYLRQVDPPSALALAGYWCACFCNAAAEPKLQKLRRYQFESAGLAWKLAAL
jgi:hypothetical protein